ncbi:MAG: glycoside hydrolase family 2 protein [Promethearchaeota archaeon]
MEKWELLDSSELRVDIRLKVTNPGFYIHLETSIPKWQSSDNYFTMIPQVSRLITLQFKPNNFNHKKNAEEVEEHMRRSIKWVSLYHLLTEKSKQ